MRMRRRGEEATSDFGAGDASRVAAWDGLRGAAGPSAVIRATRAGDVVVLPAETLQVA